ncbi:MAG: DUF4350 domain-containing protein [Planctomycetota bacterium]
MKRGWVWLLTGAVGFASVAALLHLAIQAGRGGETTPLYSVRRFDPYGTAALYRLAERRLTDVTTLERPSLDPDQTGVLVQVLPTNSGDAHALTEADALAEWDVPGDVYALPTSALLEWVAAGNTLIQLTRGQTPLMDALGIGSTIDHEGSLVVTNPRLDVESHQRRGATPDTRPGMDVEVAWLEGEDAFAMSLREPRRFEIKGPEGWRPTLRMGGLVYGGVIEHGEGSIVLVGAPTPALNQHLRDGDHLAWWLTQLDDGPAVFDEWAHGIGHAGSVIETLAYFGLVPLLFQTGLWLAAYRWSTAGRTFIDPDQDRRPPRNSAEEIDTLARLYDQAWDDTERRRRTHDEVVTRLAEACRCRPDELPARLKARSGPTAEAAALLLKESGALAASDRPSCPKCHYELRGSVGDHCPECGELIPRRVRQAVSQSSLPDVDPAAASVNTNRHTLPDLLKRSAQLAEELRRARRS